MEPGLASYGFALLAGTVSTLSPCVLPILPILLGAAANAHRQAPLALAGGLALSYALIGTAFAWASGALGIEAGLMRGAGAVVLGALGLVLLSASLQQRLAWATSGLGNAGNDLLARLRLDGLAGQFVIGLVLGVVWSPCVGPTLGAAIVLASQGTHLPQAAALMGLFGLGAAMPVLALAYASRSALVQARGALLRAGKAGKALLGVILVGVAVVVLSGADKRLETWIVERTPDWITDLTTRY